MNSTRLNNPLHTIIVSDIHLGSLLSRANHLTKLLKERSFKRLILLGDIFDDLNLNRLTPEHWEFLAYVRELSENGRHIDVVWAQGNHDARVANVMKILGGIPVYHEYAWKMNGKKYLAIHGDVFDSYLFNDNIFGNTVRLFYRIIEKIDRGEKSLTRFIGRCHTIWLRISPRVAHGAAQHAKKHGFDYIFCGHTHEAIHRVFFEKEKPVHYFNTGCWIQSPSTYIAITDDGAVSICKF
jgi:UDP-2,3-diacylglucosamine pyrophosphatase LpxH